MRLRKQKTLLAMIFLGCGLWGASLAKAQSIPPPSWPGGLSDFCVEFLDSCYTQCFRMRSNLRDESGKPFPPKVLGYFCRQTCWDSPARKQICKMTDDEFFRYGEAFEKRERERLKVEAERIEREKAEEAKRREEEAKKHQETLKQRNEEEARLKAEREEIRRLRDSMRQQQEALKKARERAQADNAAKAQMEAMRKQLEEQKKNMALQRQLVEEERKRLALLQKKAEEEKQAEKQRQEEESRRVAELEKLRKERLSELEALKQQRLEEEKGIQELKKIAEREKKLVEERKRLEEEQLKAIQEKKAERLEAMKKLQQELNRKAAQVRARKKRIERRRDRVKSNQEKRIKKIETLAAVSEKKIKEKKKRRRSARRSAGVLAFQEGKIEEAIGYYEKKKEKEKIAKLKEFQESYRRGKDAFQRRDAHEGIPLLERSFTLDIELSDGGSSYTRLIRRMLSNMHAIRGMASFGQRDYPAAFRAFNAAYRHDTKNEAVKQKLQQLREVAEDLYKQGLQHKDSDMQACRRLMRQVIRMTTPKEKIHIEAKKILE